MIDPTTLTDVSTPTALASLAAFVLLLAVWRLK